MAGKDFVIEDGVLKKYKGSDEHVVIPEGVTSIGEWAFDGYSRLTSITIPDGVTSIGVGAFSSCSSLTSIVIPDGVTSIDESAFRDTPWLEQQGALVIVNGILLKYQGEDTEICIPDGVTSIGARAFFFCRSLTSITIPDSVTSIGAGAFEYCESLTSITIPESVTSIGWGAFSSCSSLMSIVIPDGVTSIDESTFRDTPWLEQQGALVIVNGILLKYQGEDTEICIPDSVTSIGDGAFYNCSSLTSITIPDGVTSIGEEAFNGCSSLTSITIPDSVTSIGDRAFYDCSSLTSITIPDGVTNIGDEAFNYCFSLTSITIPDSVTSIGEWAFYGCSSLTSIVIPKGVTDIGADIFNKCDNLKIIKTGTKLTSKVFGKYFKSRPIITDDPSVLPNNIKPCAAIGFAEQPDAPDTPRAKAHIKYIESNAAKLMEEAFEHPVLLHLMLENKLLKPEVAQVYVDEAIRRKLPEATAALLDYQQNKLSAAEKKKSADKAAAREETVTSFVFDTENLTVLQGKVFVVTGKLKTFASHDELKACLDTCQAILTENLDKDTDYLLTNTPNSGTAKNKKAESLGVKKITEDEFNQMIGRHPQ